MKMPTPDEYRAEFHRLNADLASAQAKITPKQEAFDAKHAEITALEEKELKPLREDLKRTREALGIHQIQMQMGLIVRALNGETGAPPNAETGQA